MATNGSQARDGGRLDHLRLRLRVARQRTKLDAALANGAPPDGDPELVLRARQLTAPSTRHAIAGAIDDLLAAAEQPHEAFAVSSRPPLRGDEILASRTELRAVAEVLDEPRPLPPRAAALAAQLVWDSASPMYAVGLEASVAEVADEVLEAAA